MQEQIVQALVRRVARDVGIPPRAIDIETRNGAGGVPAAIAALERYVADIVSGVEARPDVLVVVVDADCDGPASRRKAITDRIVGIAEGVPCIVIGVPDPHIERWYLLDAAAIHDALGHGPAGERYPDGCAHDAYKNALKATISAAGGVPRLGGYEYADLIVDRQDLYACGQEDPEFGRYVDDLRDCFQRLAA